MKRDHSSDIPVLLCILPAIVAAAAAFGWWLDAPSLRNPFPNQPPVAPSTVMCLTAICVAIICRDSHQRVLRGIAVAATIAAAAISSLVAIHYITPGLQIDIEQLFFVGGPGGALTLPHAGGFAPGRMAPNTAACFILLA